ncbi:MAG: DUF3313 family protein [Pseudomonadales bacterium]|nr:DUF3313 family protein [Pseudomonadales bacterium]
MRILYTLIVVGSLAACQSTPTLQSGPDAEIGPEGLVRVDNTSLDVVFLRPGIDLSSYDSIMLVGAGINYRSVREANNLRLANADEFPLDDRQKETIEAAVIEVFEEEMAESNRYRLVLEPGPDTLSLSGALIDVVSYIPPERVGRVSYYLSSLGAATLLLELRDSESGQLLARAADGRTIETDTFVESNRVSNRFELERDLDRWADRVRAALEYVLDTPVLPVAE